MNRIPISNIPLTDAEQAPNPVAELFDEIQREMQVPMVPAFWRAQAVAPDVMSGVWAGFRQIVMGSSLPATVAGMIAYSVSAANRCHYCNSLHKLNCRSLGVDDATLAALDSNHEAIEPSRVREIIKFAVTAGTQPESLTAEDYDRVRKAGLSDREIVETISLAAWVTFADRIAESLKIDLDPPFVDALAA